MEREAVCRLEEIVPGAIRGASLRDGRRIALYNVEGSIYATDDECTHGQASLSDEGSLNGSIVECAWHYGTFDVTTGAACSMPCEHALRTYPVAVVDGVVYVEA